MFGKVAKVLKMLVFHVFGAFVGWLILVHLGLEGLGVFVVLVCVFLLFRFCFCLFWLCFCFVVGLLLVLFLFLGGFCVFSSFCFFFGGGGCFFGGFKGQVRWPKGPPHLALNLLIFVLFFVAFLFFCVLFEGSRVR